MLSILKVSGISRQSQEGPIWNPGELMVISRNYLQLNVSYQTLSKTASYIHKCLHKNMMGAEPPFHRKRNILKFWAGYHNAGEQAKVKLTSQVNSRKNLFWLLDLHCSKHTICNYFNCAGSNPLNKLNTQAITLVILPNKEEGLR